MPIVASGFTIAWMVGRGAGVRHALPMIAIIASVYALGQNAIASVDPILATFVPAGAALLLLYPLSHWERYSEPAEGVDASRAFTDDTGEELETADTHDEGPAMGLGIAMLPYAALTLVAVAALTIPPLRSLLERVEIGPAFPATITDFDLEVEATSSYSPVTLLTHPGGFLLIGAAVAAVVLHRVSSRDADGSTMGLSADGDRPSLWAELLNDATPPSAAVVAFLILSAVLEHSGQIATLASGVEAVAPGPVYVVRASTIGLLGSFMTTSNTSSNVLFAPLQQAAADGAGLLEANVIGAQHAGGAIGNSIAPANIALGTGTAGISGQEGNVLRRRLPFAIATSIAVGLLALVLEMLA